MAKIAQYENSVTGLQTTDEGTRAVAQAAYRSGRFFDQVGSATEQVGQQNARMVGQTVKDVGEVAVDYAVHKDTSQYNEASSALVAKKAQDWNKAISGVKNPDGSWAQKPLDPDDPNAVKGFMDGLNSDLDKLKDSMFTDRGQEHAENHNAAIRDHFQTTTTADLSTAAAVAAKEKTIKTINNYSNAAVSDPAGVERYADLAKNAIEGEFGNHPALKGAAGLKEKSEFTIAAMKKIYQGAAMSAIQKSSNPEATAASFAQKYPDYIDGAEALTLAKAARTQIKFNQAQDRADQVAQRQLQKDDADKFGAGLVAQIIKPDGTFNPATPGYFQQLRESVMPGPKQLPGMTTAKAIELFKFGQTESDIKVSDVPTKVDLQEKLYTGHLDPMEIVKAANDKKISHADAGILEGQRKLLEEHPQQDKGYEAAMSGAKAALVVPTAYSDFMQDFLPQYLQKKRDGKLTAGDLNFKDPNSMISKAMAAHEPSQADKIQYQTLKNTGMGITDKNALEVMQAPTVPPSMSVKDAIATYGAGKLVKRNGQLQRLPEKAE